MLLIFQHRNEISKLHGTSSFSWDFCVATIIAIYFSAKLVTDVVLLSLDYEYLKKKKKKERKREKYERDCGSILANSKRAIWIRKEENKPLF